jgi:UDP-glucose 4-epimerase
MQRILVTGAGGFIGRKLTQALLDAGYEVTAATRNRPGFLGRAHTVAVGSIGPDTDWSTALEGCSAVIHLAAQTPGPGVTDEAFMRVNDGGTMALTRQALRSNVTLFVHMSSVFALVDNASQSVVTDAFASRASLPYGRSKLVAEAHVDKLAGEGIAAVTLRPPLVYGAEAKGNWRQLQKLALTGVPLPFGAIANRRSLIAAENLVDAVMTIVSRSPGTLVSGKFLVADGEAVSTAEILRLLREGMGLPPRLWRVPQPLLAAAMKSLGRGRMAQSLLGNLEVNCEAFRKAYGWNPVVTAEQAICQSGRAFAAMTRTEKSS